MSEEITVTATDLTAGNERTFTQEDVNELIKKRLEREKSKYADYDELRAYRIEAEKNRLESLSENEKAIEAARVEGAKLVRAEYSRSLASAEIRAALTGLVDDPAVVIEDLDLLKFIDENDKVNADAIFRLKEKYQNLVGKKATTPFVNIGHGRSTKVTGNSTLDDFTDVMDSLLGNR